MDSTNNWSLSAVPIGDVKLVLGDLKAKIGEEDSFFPTIGKNSLYTESNVALYARCELITSIKPYITLDDSHAIVINAKCLTLHTSTSATSTFLNKTNFQIYLIKRVYFTYTSLHRYTVHTYREQLYLFDHLICCCAVHPFHSSIFMEYMSMSYTCPINNNNQV